MTSDKDIIAECTEKLDVSTAQSYEKLEHYFLGTQPLNFLTPEARRRCGNRLTSLHIDYPRLVLRANEERCTVEDFRLASQESYAPAWDIWQRNNMDEQAPLGHLDAFLYGRAIVSVWAKNGKATMRCESPKQVWIEHDPGDTTVRYGIKRWFDKDRGYMNVVTPQKITKYRTSGKRDEGMDITNLPPDSWEATGESVENRTGRVPYFPLIHRRRVLNPHGESLLTDVLPIADAMNKLATDLMSSAEAHAEPRRWATGVEIVEDEDGEVTDSFSVLKGRTWTAEDPAARIGSLPEADLSNFINAISMFQMHMAALAGLPPHYFDAAKGSLASAESIRASEASLVSQVRRAMVSFGSTWEDAMRFALELENVTITPAIEKMEVRWKDPENRTQAQAMDSAIKLQALNIPTLQIWEDLGYSKAQIERMKKMKETEDAQRAERAPAEVPGAAGPGAVAGQGARAGQGNVPPRLPAPGLQR